MLKHNLRDWREPTSPVKKAPVTFFLSYSSPNDGPPTVVVR